MTTTTATPLPVSAAGQYDCTIEDGRRPRPVTITKYLVDERVTVFSPDGWNYRVAVIEVSTDGDVHVSLIRQTRRGHRDYRNGFGFSLTLDDFATGPTSSPQHLAGLVARIRATVEPGPGGLLTEHRAHGGHVHTRCDRVVPDLAAHAHSGLPTHSHGPNGAPVPVPVEEVSGAELVEGDVFSIDGGHSWHVAAVNLTWGGTMSVYLYPDRRRTDRSPCVRVSCGEPTRVLRQVTR